MRERSELLARLENYRNEPCDVLVVGGGATGLCCALDAALRGLTTVLLESHDFAKGTSSRSTKILHGGVRYLRQGQLGLVRQSLIERGIWLERAPGLTQTLNFAIPCDSRWSQFYYGAGLKLYDRLAGRRGLAPSHFANAATLANECPNLRKPKFAVVYQDAQFDDARLAIALAMAAADSGAVGLNYLAVREFTQTGARLRGVIAEDRLTGREYRVQARTIINAAGVFSDAVRALPGSGETSKPTLAPSQGIHLVLPKRFLGGETALMIPQTDDGRVLFAVPWHGRVLLGTTDTPQAVAEEEPAPLEEEIDYLIEHASRFLHQAPSREDIVSVFAGLRPLVRPAKDAPRSASISRDHQIIVSPVGLISVTGGKWTTARHMAEDAVNRAIAVGQLKNAPCLTQKHPLSGDSDFMVTAETPTEAEIRRAVSEEMAMTVEDVLARRTRLLFLDARKSVEAAISVSQTMARCLEKDEQWATDQVTRFRAVAANYLP